MIERKNKEKKILKITLICRFRVFCKIWKFRMLFSWESLGRDFIIVHDGARLHKTPSKSHFTTKIRCYSKAHRILDGLGTSKQRLLIFSVDNREHLKSVLPVKSLFPSFISVSDTDVPIFPSPVHPLRVYYTSTLFLSDHWVPGFKYLLSPRVGPIYGGSNFFFMTTRVYENSGVSLLCV